MKSWSRLILAAQVFADRLNSALAVLLLATLMAGCGATTTPPASTSQSATVSVSPATVDVAVGGMSVAFAAIIRNSANAGVIWQVDGVPGGNATVGTISASGLYVSPATVPSPATVTVTAVSAADPSQSGSAALTLTASAPQVSVSVSPDAIDVLAGGDTQTFAATVKHATNAAVTWQVNGAQGGDSIVGTISTAGVYTPPAIPPAQPTVTVSALSVQDPTKAGAAKVKVTKTPLPKISGRPPTTVQVGQGYMFTPTASSPRSATLTFSIANAPAWAAFSMTTGQLSGTPATTDVGVDANITISVTDGTGTVALTPFTITVTTTARLTIGGTPVTSVKADQAYAFTPSASSPSGAPLTFSIANKPAWASFSTATGELAGTPTTTDIGTSANVTISVSDGTAAASLMPFTITVQSGATGSATLSWIAPSTRTDGTPLTNLAGFRIYYGTTQGSYPNVISVANPGIASYVIPNMPSGTYYFVTTAYDANGLESDYGNAVSTTIP